MMSFALPLLELMHGAINFANLIVSGIGIIN
jgi:hypothetical protein